MALEPVIFPFNFCFNRTCYPRDGHGKINGRTAKLLGSSVGRIRRVSMSETALAATLVSRDGYLIDLRVFDGRLFRAVRSPGSFKPCTVEDFQDAAQGRSSWRDSPFSPPRSNMIKADVVLGEAKSMDAYDARRWDPDSKEEEVLHACVDRLAGMIVVDDIVYRSCEEPRLVIRFKNEKKMLALAWTSGDIDYHEDPVNGILDNNRYNPPYRKNLENYVNIYDKFVGNNKLSIAVFPIHRKEDAVKFMNELGAIHSCDIDSAEVVSYYDNDFLSEIEDMPDLFNCVRNSFGAQSTQIWKNILVSDRSVVETWLDARDLLNSMPEVVDAEDMRRGLEAMLPLEKCIKSREVETENVLHGAAVSAILTRWRVVDRNRDLRRVLAGRDADDEFDDEALAVFR